jgi:phosphoribosylaminoimidazolecarboxamide formyltransferase/IMP cyclohydrolase
MGSPLDTDDCTGGIMSKTRRALISVSDKTDIVEFGRELADLGFEILSTGGTARSLREGGVAVKDVSEHTGFPEMMDGRLKTLHPKIHGGLLGRRGRDDAEMQAHGIETIDVVVVNLYPFEATVSKPGVSFDDAIENIDIGGPTMLRAAAKNHRDVAVVVEPGDYRRVLDEISAGGEVSSGTKAELALKVFRHTARYDAMIADYLTAEVPSLDKGGLPFTYTTTYKRVSDLRYGENPHQKAAAYAERTGGLSLFDAHVLQGREMSFNNYLDTHAALMLALEFDAPTSAIIKHCNPCGVGSGDGPADAFAKAFRTDPTSAYGGVISFNCPVDGDAAREIVKGYIEVVIAPGFTDEARSTFASKPNIRLLMLEDMKRPMRGLDARRIAGGVLVQEWDTHRVDFSALTSVTSREPNERELKALEFAWKVCKHVKSNAVVYAHEDRTAGIGVGQTARVYATRVGAINASESLEGTVVASDGFFPFKDSIEGIKRVGVTALVQPGGSVGDVEVIEKCNDLNLSMLITGYRHFSH